MHQFFSGPKPRIFGHRGAMGVAPENTLLSFRQAVLEGAPYVEFDVHSTRDGKIIILHDPTLDRTTNGEGKVQEYTLEELQRFDAGYRFSPRGGSEYPLRGRGITVPTLQEVLMAFPGVRMTVEIKQAVPPIEEKILECVYACARTGHVLLASEHDAVVKRVRSLDSSMATSFSAPEVADFAQRVQTRHWTGYLPPAPALQIPPTFAGIPLVTEESVKAAHDLGVEVHVWTVNDPQEMDHFLDLGVDGIMTDFPARLREVIGQRRTA